MPSWLGSMPILDSWDERMVLALGGPALGVAFAWAQPSTSPNETRAQRPALLRNPEAGRLFSSEWPQMNRFRTGAYADLVEPMPLQGDARPQRPIGGCSASPGRSHKPRSRATAPTTEPQPGKSAAR